MLHSRLLTARLLMDAAELVAGYNAVNVDLKKDGVQCMAQTWSALRSSCKDRA